MKANQMSNQLVNMFTACPKFAYTPKAWQEARVVFIPEPDKTSNTTAKAFRPIDTMIKSKIPNETLKFKEHSYVKGLVVEQHYTKLYVI